VVTALMRTAGKWVRSRDWVRVVVLSASRCLHSYTHRSVQFAHGQWLNGTIRTLVRVRTR